MNSVVTASSTAPIAAPSPLHDVCSARPLAGASVLGWPAWLRLLAVLPAVVLLWLGVAWAQLDVVPW